MWRCPLANHVTQHIRTPPCCAVGSGWHPENKTLESIFVNYLLNLFSDVIYIAIYRVRLYTSYLCLEIT